MAAPSEHCREDINGDDDDEYSAKMYDLDDLFEKIKKQVPTGQRFFFGLTRPAENRGQDIVPVLVARKAPCSWSRDLTAADGMFIDGDTVLWVARAGSTRRVFGTWNGELHRAEGIQRVTSCVQSL